MYIIQIAGLDDSQAGSKIARRNKHRYADDATLMAESEEELKDLNEGERGEWKSWLKTQHSWKKIMASGLLITSWQIYVGKVESVRFHILCSKITVDSDCSHKLKDTHSMEEKLWQTKTVY